MVNKILITKDALRADYLSCYGGQYWKTPNIDELANKGTQFVRHYTAAPSTAMSVTSMFSEKYPHEIDRKEYSEVDQYKDRTLFDSFKEVGMSSFVIWPIEWDKTTWLYSKVFPKHVELISMSSIAQGIKKDTNSKINNDDKVSRETLDRIIIKIDSILSNNDKSFTWLHLPHVIKGRTAYGSDIDLFDKLVGKLRKRFSDDSIYISSDHGHMNYDKGIPVYGFHVYESSIKVPLIVPRIDNNSIIDFPTSHTQLKEIIFSNKVNKRKYIYSDTQYYLQDNRKLAIIKGKFKYIFNKKNKTEELYDLDYDSNENVNLLMRKVYDRNRLGYYNLDETYYYPYFGKLSDIYNELSSERKRIWKQGSWAKEFAYILNNLRKLGFKNIGKSRTSRKVLEGHFGSKVKNTLYEE